MKSTYFTNDANLKKLQKSALLLHQSLDVNVTLEATLDCLKDCIPYDTASIMLLDSEGFLVIKATRGYDKWLPNGNNFQDTAFPVNKASLPIHDIYQNHESNLIPDVRDEPGWQAEIAAGAVIRNWLGVPLIADGRFVGLISLDKMEPNIFDQTHVELVEQIAAHAALALQNAQLFQAEQTRSQKLQQAQAILFDAEKSAAIGRLTTAISHEINNPIQAILGCLELLSEELKGPNQQDSIDRYLNIIQTELQRITVIINQMRNSNPIQTNNLRRPCDINNILDNILRQNEKQIDAKKIALQRKWANNLPLINANEDNLSQAFQNIFNNALEVLKPGERLALETELCPVLSRSRPPLIKITIQNSGQPIPDDIQKHLFEPFITTKEKQFGLGLFVTYSIIEAHGGKIKATSTAEQGTTFTIHLPVPSLPPTNEPN